MLYDKGPRFRVYRVVGGLGSPPWRFMGSSKKGYKSPNMVYKYGCPTYNPTYNYP